MAKSSKQQMQISLYEMNLQSKAKRIEKGSRPQQLKAHLFQAIYHHLLTCFSSQRGMTMELRAKEET
jgi:K+-sensing histidine kinase KdpD